MQRYFISSSGTGVGKTLITAALAHQYLQDGQTVQALKPIVTGYDRSSWLPKDSDTALLLKSMDIQPSQAAIDAISLWRLSAPLSPNMAARRENVTIDLREVLSFCKAAEKKKPDVLLVEGVGGVMVPLNNQHTVLDWIRILKYPVILVLGNYLGSISHGITAYNTLRLVGAEVPLVIISESEESSVTLMETAETFAHFIDTHIMTVPRLHAREKVWEQAPEMLSMLKAARDHKLRADE